MINRTNAIAACVCAVLFCFAGSATAAPELDSNFLGITMVWVNDPTVKEIFKEYDVPSPPGRGGIFVLSVLKKAPGSVLEAGDVITSIDGVGLIDEKESFERIRTLKPGKYEFSVLRGVKTRRGKKEWRREKVPVEATTYRNYVLGSIETKTDDFTGTSVTVSKLIPDDFPLTGIFLRLIEKDGSLHPAIRVQLQSDDWLFANSFLVLIDGETFEFSSKECDFKRHVVSGRDVREWTTVMGPKVEEMIPRLTDATKVAVRFSGEKFKHDYEAPSGMVHALNVTATAYAIMKK